MSGISALRRAVSPLVVMALAMGLLAVASIGSSAGAARASHEVSHPQPSGADCRWYGSVEFSQEVHVKQESGYTQDTYRHGAGWSSSSTDPSCRGSVSWRSTQTDSDGRCTATIKSAGTVAATYGARWTSTGEFTAGFYGNSTLTETTTGACDGQTGEPTTREIEVAATGVCAVPGVDTAAERTATQAIVVTCSQTMSETPEESWTATIRMRRTVCDETIDSDHDGLSDCTEFALQTDPHNPDTDGDGLTDGQEVLRYKTDPRNVDTDAGGVPDGTEVAGGTDPLDPADDNDQCRYVNIAFVAKLVDQEHRNIDPDVYLDVLRYSWDDLRYCWGNRGVRIVSTGSQRGEVVDTALEVSALELIGMKWKFDGSQQASVERLTDGSLEAKVRGKFDVCAQIPLLGPVVGKGIKKILDSVPERIRKRLLEWGPKKIMNSLLIPAWVKNEIIERGVRVVLRSFEALSDEDFRRVMGVFAFVADKVSGKLVELLTDGKCFATWRPELVFRLYPDASGEVFGQSVEPQWWMLPAATGAE